MNKAAMSNQKPTNNRIRRFWIGAWLAGCLGAANGLAAVTPPNAGLTPVASPQTPSVVAALAPRIHVAEPTHDFGKVPSGEQRTHEFLVTNEGTGPLEILQVRTSCGCTTTGQWDRRIEPGATGRIPVRFDTGSFSGTLQRTVTLVTNDPRQRQVVMQVKAEIWVPVEVSPKTVMFQYDSESTEGETKIVRLLSHLDQPLQFSEVRSSHPSFALNLETVNPGREFTLQIRTVPPIGTGMITAPLLLQPADTNLAPIRITAYAIERQPLTISPASLMLPAGPARAGTRPSVTIRNNTSQALELTDPQINVPGATVEIAELQSNRLFRLTPVFPEGFELPAGQRAELTVKSNHPRHPEIRVPVLASRPMVRTPASTSAAAPRSNVVLRPVSRPAPKPPGLPPVP
jgi:hypothetical protein